MRTEMICFFEQLVSDLKSGNLSKEQEQKLSEFYISQKFSENKNDELTEKEILKYVALGWFMYNYNKNV